MKLNDSITTYDIAEALQGETGKFEVTSPTGERYFVTCQPGHSITSLAMSRTFSPSWSARWRSLSPWRDVARDPRPLKYGDPQNKARLLRPGFFVFRSSRSWSTHAPGCSRASQ